MILHKGLHIAVQAVLALYAQWVYDAKVELASRAVGEACGQLAT